MQKGEGRIAEANFLGRQKGIEYRVCTSEREAHYVFNKLFFICKGSFEGTLPYSVAIHFILKHAQNSPFVLNILNNFIIFPTIVSKFDLTCLQDKKHK